MLGNGGRRGCDSRHGGLCEEEHCAPDFDDALAGLPFGPSAVEQLALGTIIGERLTARRPYPCLYCDSVCSVCEPFNGRNVSGKINAAAPTCTNCGEAHVDADCPRRCVLCGGFGPPDSDGVHRECFEADRAGRDLPEGEAGRKAWREEQDRGADDLRVHPMFRYATQTHRGQHEHCPDCAAELSARAEAARDAAEDR